MDNRLLSVRRASCPIRRPEDPNYRVQTNWVLPLPSKTALRDTINQMPAPPFQPVPILDLSREFALIRDEVMAAIESVCVSQRFILGPEVTQFEHSAAAACEVPYAVGCASGTDALWLALASLNIGEGDTVITTPFSFFATVSSILRVGATPLLADIDERTFNLSPIAVAEAAEKHGNITAVMPVHLYGQCADMDAFATLAAQHDFKLIEDAAQAFGARFNDIPAGALGDAAAFSFYPTKNLAAMGDAGLLTTHDAATDDHARILRAHGMRQRYFHEEVGWNSRLDSIQAAVLEIKLKRVHAGNQRRREIAALYDKLFTAAALTATSTDNGVVLPYTDPRAEHVFHQYVIRAPRRDELRAFLSEHKIGSEIYYPLPLHLQESLKHLGYKRGDFPHSERAAEEVLALPMFPELREDEVETVVEAIRRFHA
jgi:dTDP-4-amino-4,6-dideoxygalactose transaminase